MSRCILIVDDEADVREIAQLGLEMGSDWSVLTASSGAEALELAATHRPDAILLDVMMPELDGRATLQQLKAQTATCHIPVILVTAKAHPAHPTDFAQLAVAGVVAKPFRPLNLAADIAQILGW